MSAKTIGNSYFYLKNDLFWVHKWAIVNEAHFYVEIGFKDIGRQINKLSETFYFFEKSSDLIELCLLLYPELHFRVEIGPFPAVKAVMGGVG